MRTIPYDPSRTALYRPHAAPTLLRAGPCSDELLCAEAARLAYKRFEDRPEAAREICQVLGAAGFAQVDFFACEGSQAFAAAGEKATLISFRGTTSGIDDIVTDLKTWPKRWPAGGRVHSGFCDAFGRLRGVLESWLSSHAGRALFTGHSLGGALATLAASVFKPALLITFGTPRVGDTLFTETLDGVDWLRYANCCDLVTRVPPELLGFCHRGELRYIDRDGAIHINPPADWTREDSRHARSTYLREQARRPGVVKLRDLADHAPINYIFPILALDEFQSASQSTNTKLGAAD